MKNIEKLQEIFRDVFDDEELVITPETCADNIEEWDSLSHVNLLVAIEREFGVKFALGETEKLKNISAILNAIDAKS